MRVFFSAFTYKNVCVLPIFLYLTLFLSKSQTLVLYPADFSFLVQCNDAYVMFTGVIYRVPLNPSIMPHVGLQCHFICERSVQNYIIHLGEFLVSL